MALRGNRDQLVISTKYTSDYRYHAASRKGTTTNHGGNHRRSLHMSLRDSLRKLQTDFIDILYLHFWDYTTSIPEIMDSLASLVQQGKVLYLGISDTPAWVVAAANTYAASHGRPQFSVYQGRWSILARDLEREIIPMARHFGMAIVPWGVLGSGRLQTRQEAEERARNGDPVRSFGGLVTETHYEVADALLQIGKQHGVESVTAVAAAYILSKAATLGVKQCFPVIGGRRPEQLHENIKALSIRLTSEEIGFLEGLKPFEIGFPSNFVGLDPNVTGNSPMLERTGFLEFPDATNQGWLTLKGDQAPAN
jgi:aryl-alcohol dehydrogenase-like predicted oxidoreductase